jgi:hypothetical protein
MMQLEQFLKLVHERPSTNRVFNPWRDCDPLNDLSEMSPEYRFSHLSRYMNERVDSAKILLIAEAPGFRGAKFSGSAMTSERDVISSGQIGSQYFEGQKFRTSKTILSSGKMNATGSIEPTASIVWKTMLPLCHSHEFVLWNSFAWHPHEDDMPLTNRTPTDMELNHGLEVLQAFLNVFPQRSVVAIGRRCEMALGILGVQACSVRHPANGGASKFKEGIRQCIEDNVTAC